MALKLINDLALTQKMSLAVADMALDVSGVIEEQRPRHAHDTLKVGQRERRADMPPATRWA